MIRLPAWLCAGGLVWLAGQALATTGNPVAQLVSEQRLHLSSSLVPDRGIVPGQRVSLVLTLATERWFSGGTRIRLPEVPGLVLLQTQQFATNASETRDGRSWVVQRWTLDVYPQRAGEFTIPPLAVRVKVNVEGVGDAEGELRTSPVSFRAGIPPALARAEHWVAAPAFTVRQAFDRALENLQVGDAFEREIVFEASDVLAMMLPAVRPESIAGLATYPLPPVLANSSNRGQTTASRSQRISYVVEAHGVYRLPAREYMWWDTGTAQLQLLSLPAIEITVGTGPAPAHGAGGWGPSLSRGQLLTGVGGLLVVGVLLWLARRGLARWPLLAWLRDAWARLAGQLRALRKPALAAGLNPGSSAAE